jgi:Zn-dependent protease with chaperone function
MNFFEHQDKARKQSRWLVLVFALAVLSVVAAVDIVLLLTLGGSNSPAGGWQPFSAQSLGQNLSLLAGGALATVLVIGLASLVKTVKLRTGGGQVARELGGSLLESDPRDPLRRRLRNVVEEIALASGVPVPEIYVLEQEAGINAFAAGYTPADAAITVTRGTLEKLDRNELQGVVAHEFSHILNGDMRINIRLMGALFGILLLALIGQRILMHSRYMGRSRGKNGSAILFIALGLTIVGYIGLFFGRWIKAAIARQREYLADASAVQFTRDPDGIGGALKKIAVYSEGSLVVADTEEISHMLFADGRKMLLFSTHPPLDERIRRIEPAFKAEDLDRLAARLATEQQQQPKERSAGNDKVRTSAAAAVGGAGWIGAGGLIDQIGQPNGEHILMAAALAASIPENVRQAAQSAEWAAEVLFYVLLERERETREQQLLQIAQRMGADSEARVRALLTANQVPTAIQRLPLLELSFPALKRRPPEFVARVLAAVQELVRLDGRVDVFEFLLARLISQHLWESQNPHLVRTAGNLTLSRCMPEASRVLAVLAVHGQESSAAATAAFRAGMNSLAAGEAVEMPVVDDWVNILDQDLPQLDRMRASDKQRLVNALLLTVAHDGKTIPVELELLRVSCSLIHVPLPMLTGFPGERHTTS